MGAPSSAEKTSAPHTQRVPVSLCCFLLLLSGRAMGTPPAGWRAAPGWEASLLPVLLIHQEAKGLWAQALVGKAFVPLLSSQGPPEPLPAPLRPGSVWVARGTQALCPTHSIRSPSQVGRTFHTVSTHRTLSPKRKPQGAFLS